LRAAVGLQLACLLAAGKRQAGRPAYRRQPCLPQAGKWRTQDDSAQTANAAVRAAGNTRLVKFLVDNHFL